MNTRAGSRVLVLAACLLGMGCQTPARDQPEGELCDLTAPQFSRCKPRLYCEPPQGLARLLVAFAGEVGRCTRYVRAGEHCSRTGAACEPGLFCEPQSGVCRATGSMDTTPRGADSLE